MTLTDYDVERFDVTQAPDADIDLPIEAAPARGARPAPHPAAGGLACNTSIRAKAGRAGSRSARRSPDGPVPAARRTGGQGMLAIELRGGRRGGASPAGWTPPSARPPRRSSTRVEGTVTLDCRGLEYISSAGLGVLLKTQKRLIGVGRQAAAGRRQPPPAGHLPLLGLRPDLRNRARPVDPRQPFRAAACNCGR